MDAESVTGSMEAWHGHRIEVIMSLTVNSGSDLSTLFSGLSTSSSDSSSSLLSDYASIKNGSYGKLVKAYYAKNSSKATTDEETKTNNSNVTSGATSLKVAADALISDTKLFTKSKTTKDENGVETTDYDWDSITKKVQNFVDSYNDTVKNSLDSTSNSVLSSTLSMVKGTAANSNMLKSVGITIGENNKLVLDKDALKASDINDLKSLFSGVGSYAYSVSSSASNIGNAAAKATATYTSDGSYSGLTSVSSVMDQYL